MGSNAEMIAHWTFITKTIKNDYSGVWSQNNKIHGYYVDYIKSLMNSLTFMNSVKFSPTLTNLCTDL